MYFSTDRDGAITLNFGTSTAPKIVIGQDSEGYIILDYGSDGPDSGEFPNYGHDIAGARIITYTNSNGEAMILTEQRMNPFVMCKADGIYASNNNVNIKNNAMIDGGTFYGSTMQTRNIVLTIKDIEGHDQNRDFVDMVFDKNKPGVLLVQDGSHSRAIECYVESVDTTATPLTRLTQISLLCPDPYFYDPDDTVVKIANTVPMFQFVHEFEEYGEELGRITENRMGVIYNESTSDIGVTMLVKATGYVTNPKIYLAETREHISVGTQDKPFAMQPRDVIRIQTQTGRKNVYDEDGNSINAYLSEDSDFFQLHRGENTFVYMADAGPDNIEITVMYRYKYVRA